MGALPKARVLFVDDEPRVLDGLSLHVERKFDAVMATGAREGLAALAGGEPFAVVVSDMRMPEMDGAEFLAKVRAKWPLTVRLLLTGQTDLDSAISAVNDGQIFRFLTKPCPPPTLVGAVQAAVEQHRLVTAEKELLEKTFNGILEMLGDALALANPEAFGRATRLRQYVGELAEGCPQVAAWEVESAATMSQIGYITLDADTAGKFFRGRALSPEEEQRIATVPAVTERLLAHIPRLEGMRAMLAEARRIAAPEGTEPQLEDLGPAEIGGRILRIALDFDRLDGQGKTLEEALTTLRLRVGRYHRTLLTRFAEARRREASPRDVVLLPVAKLRAGMTFLEDVFLTSGVLLAPRGYVVTDAFVERIQNANAGEVVEPVKCRLRKATGETGVAA